jgi:hypothetical protein
VPIGQISDDEHTLKALPLDLTENFNGASYAEKRAGWNTEFLFRNSGTSALTVCASRRVRFQRIAQ